MKKIIALMLAVVLVMSLVACGGTETPETTPSTTPGTEPVSYTEMGEGATTFYFTVQDLDGTVKNFKIKTDAKTVGEALVAVKLIEGDQSDYGLMVHTVNGIKADWATEQAYWAFYINGEYAMTGVDSTDVVADATYSFVKTKG